MFHQRPARICHLPCPPLHQSPWIVSRGAHAARQVSVRGRSASPAFGHWLRNLDTANWVRSCEQLSSHGGARGRRHSQCRGGRRFVSRNGCRVARCGRRGGGDGRDGVDQRGKCGRPTLVDGQVVGAGGNQKLRERERKRKHFPTIV